jgi:alkaline phosphatase D
MKRLSPAFLVSTGDNVYYDIDLPMATSVELARYHWHRMYSQPLLVEFFRTVPGYWMKDDHDSFEDDDWQTRQPLRVAPMTWQDLAPVFSEQVPIGKKTYRSFRWGKGLEIWLVETRDFRSPNPDPDGPRKTIWGAEQKAWLKKSLLASDAVFRVLISPDCIVGPGGEPSRARFELPEGGADSQGDGGFAHEGREFRHWVRENKLANLIIVNGDRHWQYHSVDPETGLHEFSCGAVSDSHASDSPYNPKYHRFLRIKGGFITVSLEGTEASPRLVVQHHDVDGQVVHQAVFSR